MDSAYSSVPNIPGDNVNEDLSYRVCFSGPDPLPQLHLGVQGRGVPEEELLPHIPRE